MLSTEIKTHKIILTDWREFAVEEKYAKEVFALKSDKNISQNKFVRFPWFMGELSKIKEIIKIERVNTQWMWYYCDFGVQHYIHENCNCAKLFNCNTTNFQSKLAEMYPKVNYNSQIDETMRKNVLLQLWKSV